MSHGTSWRDDLQCTAKIRGIELSQDDLAELRQASDESPLAIWSRDYLNTSNTLSDEEVEIWQHIYKNQTVPLGKPQDEALSTPIDEASLRKTIAALEASTRMTETQINVLRQQNSLLAPYRPHEGLNNTQNTAFQTTYERKQQTEAQQLKFHNAELSTALRSTIRGAREKIEKQIKSLPSQTTHHLHADDRTFETLNDTILNTNNSNQFNLLSHKLHQNQLLSTLQQTLTLRTQIHLSTTYLETLLHTPTPEHLSRVHDSELHHLQADLSSLHSEISDMVTMLTHSQHGSHLNQLTTSIETRQKTQSLQNETLAFDTIEDMTNHLLEMDQRIQMLSSYRTVIHEIETSLFQLQGHHHAQTQSRMQHPPPSETTQPPALSALLKHLNLTTLSSSPTLPSVCAPPNLNPFLNTTTPTTTTFKSENNIIASLEQALTRAKLALETLAARDDVGGEARSRFVRGWSSKQP